MTHNEFDLLLKCFELQSASTSVIPESFLTLFYFTAELTGRDRFMTEGGEMY
jgi:hypothetical protein